jgi:hypothetical protein
LQNGERVLHPGRIATSPVPYKSGCGDGRPPSGRNFRARGPGWHAPVDPFQQHRQLRIG